MTNIPEIGSEGAWAACDECAALIESRDKDALMERCLATFKFVEVTGRSYALKELRKLHRQFFQSRYGAVERIRINTPQLRT